MEGGGQHFGGRCTSAVWLDDHGGLEVRVAAGVLHQVVAAHEPLLTHRALEFLLARVRAIVSGQLVRAGKLLQTLWPGARKRSLSCVSPHVCFQMRRFSIHFIAPGKVTQMFFRRGLVRTLDFPLFRRAVCGDQSRGGVGSFGQRRVAALQTLAGGGIAALRVGRHRPGFLQAGQNAGDHQQVAAFLQRVAHLFVLL